jgi:hypothetical protein
VSVIALQRYYEFMRNFVDVSEEFSDLSDAISRHQILFEKSKDLIGEKERLEEEVRTISTCYQGTRNVF